MKIVAAEAIASCVSNDEIENGVVVPSIFNDELHKRVAEAVKNEAIKTGVARIK
jgi:malate dehydrogenase (oxaloacetate-decarboxylating)